MSMGTMQFYGEREISKERSEFLSRFRPVVRFVFNDNRDVSEYCNTILELLASFVEQCDPRNSQEVRRMRICGSAWNKESGIGTFWVNDEYVAHCKLFLYDGGPKKPRFIQQQRGAMARHSAVRPWRVRLSLSEHR